MVDRSLQVEHLFIAPVGRDRELVFLAASRTAAVVHGDHNIAVGGEELALEVERVGVLSIRSAVDAQQGGVLLPRLIIRRLDDQAVHLIAVRRVA